MKNLKKRISLSLATLFAICAGLGAQEVKEASDSSALTRPVFETLPDNVVIDQPQNVEDLFSAQVNKHSSQSVHSSHVGGYANAGNFQIRIYADSGQNARNTSYSELGRFKNLFPNEPAAVTFDSPMFKVTVGKYTTQEEAREALAEIKKFFPKAHIIRL